VGEGAGGADVVVREAGARDADALAGLRFRWQAVERGRVGLEPAAYADLIGRWMAAHRQSHRAFLAERDGVAVAMAWLVEVDRVPSPAEMVRRAGMLQSVYVRDDLRDDGVGSALIRHVIGVARDAGYSYLMVHPSDRSIAFYERLGFAVAERELELRFDR
jgi:GNAT superfamily N-acetyltransferase